MSHVVTVAAVVLNLSACTSTTAANEVKPSRPSSADVTATSALALFQQVRESSAAAKSVRIKVTIINIIDEAATTRIDGVITKQPARMETDVAGDLAGESSRSFTKVDDDATEILRVGGSTYLKANRAYLLKHGTAAQAKLATGKFTKVAAGSAMGKSVNAARQLLDNLYLAIEGTMDPKVQETKVDGVPAFRMTTKTHNAKIYVSADGQARLLRVEESTTSQQGVWNFTQWDAVPPVSAPMAEQMAKT